MKKYSPNLTLKDALADTEMRAVILRHIPRIESSPRAKQFYAVPLEQLLARTARPRLKQKISNALAELRLM